MERLKQFFLDQGLGPSDLPKAIIIHEVLGAGIAIGMAGTCYALQPSQTFLRPATRVLLRNRALEQSYSAALARASNITSRAPFLRGREEQTSAAENFGVSGLLAEDPTRITLALAESIALRAAIKPLTFPFKLWASWKLVLATKPGKGVAASVSSKRKRRVAAAVLRQPV